MNFNLLINLLIKEFVNANILFFLHGCIKHKFWMPIIIWGFLKVLYCTPFCFQFNVIFGNVSRYKIDNRKSKIIFKMSKM